MLRMQLHTYCTQYVTNFHFLIWPSCTVGAGLKTLIANFLCLRAQSEWHCRPYPPPPSQSAPVAYVRNHLCRRISNNIGALLQHMENIIRLRIVARVRAEAERRHSECVQKWSHAKLWRLWTVGMAKQLTGDERNYCSASTTAISCAATMTAIFATS